MSAKRLGEIQRWVDHSTRLLQSQSSLDLIGDPEVAKILEILYQAWFGLAGSAWPSSLLELRVEASGASRHGCRKLRFLLGASRMPQDFPE
jgi:hypothetical protein